MKSKRNKFTLKIVLFSIPILAFCVAVYVAFAKFPMYFFDGEYAMFQQQEDYIYNNDDYNRVIITGDSKPKCAFDPKLLSDDTYNFSLNGPTSVESYYCLKEYLENHKTPETVFISFSTNHYMEFETFWTRSVMFHRLSKADLNEIYNTALHFKDAGDILTDFDKNILNYRFYSIKKYGKVFLKACTQNRYKTNIEVYNHQCESKGQLDIGKEAYSDDLSKDANYTHFKPFDIIDYYLHKMIDMCLDYKINVILEVVPMNKATYDVCQTSFLADYSNYMKKLQDEYPQITVNTDLFYYDNEYFGDSAHFNPKGTEKYSKYIKEKYPDVFKN